MFRPNRIGTPVIHTQDESIVNNIPTPSTDAGTSNVWRTNIINPVPIQDFGRSALRWTGGPFNIPPGNRCSITQQFTVTQPMAGDVRGVELNFSFYGGLPDECQLTGFIAKVPTGSYTAMGLATIQQLPTHFRGAYETGFKSDANTFRHMAYQEQVVIRGGEVSLPGTYVHGVMISNNDSNSAQLLQFLAVGSVRQLNDQQLIGYADTLK